LREPLPRPRSAGRTKFLARRPANVDLPRRHDSRLRSIFRKHARESALTSPFGSSLFGDRPRSRRTQSGKRGSRFAIVIRLVVQQMVTRCCAKVCPPARHIGHVVVNSGLQNLRRRCGGREWGSMQIHRELDGRRSFFPRSPTQAGRRRATRLGRGGAAHNAV
jgi:hypothetical protein